MDFDIYSLATCGRCTNIKQLMRDRGIAFHEYDMEGDGRGAFQKFYAAHRKSIFRGSNGLALPIMYEREQGLLLQGIMACTGYILNGSKLDGFFSPGSLRKEWVDGIHISGGNPEYADEFLEVLRSLKKAYKLQIETDGRNSSILEKIKQEQLANVMIMQVLGPLELYGRLAGQNVSAAEIEKSIALTAGFPLYKFQTTVAPLVRENGEIGYLTTEEIAAVAKMIKAITGSARNPYLIQPFDQKETKDSRFKSVDKLSPERLAQYRDAAQRYQELAEIQRV